MQARARALAQVASEEMKRAARARARIPATARLYH